MPFLSTPLTLSATGGILGSAWISGSVAALSICAIPAILQTGAPTEGLLRGWHLQFTRGMYYVPTTGAFIALNYLYLAYRHRGEGLEWRGYALGALSNLLLAPFTLLFIGAINSRMIAASSGARKPLGQEAARQLITKWGNLNAVRIFMPLAGAALGLWNLLQ
ncbi:uncharacterized protein F4822DRAFT_421444 [Hypoxylon trugodes]|uniref:uncharacterized protein n=1 Tax=Hypoxylon trugodes TaxID=326681 RepID=UPI002195CC11|nr:uncharacterized protein F4822DRAFT_421444 [Hypoxylon trugodes]KAI1383694.1 hypothetical protein F4822DRAFT_421444 [Hypoxylon trugodes]